MSANSKGGGGVRGVKALADVSVKNASFFLLPREDTHKKKCFLVVGPLRI